VNIADRIGLLPGFGWMADHNFWVTLAVCLVITPIGHLVVGLIGESRLVPISPSYQFLSFFPGDVLLAVSVAGLLRLAADIDEKSAWYNDGRWHVAVLVVAMLLAGLATWDEWRSGIYPTRAIFSPTKLYHNGVLYIGYGYVIVTALIAVVFGRGVDWLFIAALVPALIWLFLVGYDSTLNKKHPALVKQKAGSAHVANWSPIWSVR
jgi:hypothetical protein